MKAYRHILDGQVTRPIPQSPLANSRGFHFLIRATQAAKPMYPTIGISRGRRVCVATSAQIATAMRMDTTIAHDNPALNSKDHAIRTPSGQEYKMARRCHEEQHGPREDRI